MLSWKDIEARRQKAGLSRAEMARRAGINESTIFKGLQRETQMTNSVFRAIDAVLAEAERAEGNAA